jgi:hypothetical protein
MRFTLSERSRQAIRSYLGEIAIIIVSILIALAFDGMVDRREERKLAKEAAVQIESEMAANKRDLDGLLASYPQTKQQLQNALKVVGRLIRESEGKERAEGGIGYELRMANVGLSTTALTTAESTGALRHMDYKDVHRYADVYTLQQICLRLHDRLYDAYVQTFPVDDLRQLTTAELQTLRHNLATTLRYVRAVEGCGTSLTKAYAGNIRPR